MRINLEQSTENPEHFVPAYNCERTPHFFAFLGKAYLTLPELKELLSPNNFEIKFLDHPLPANKNLHLQENNILCWYNIAQRRYCGIHATFKAAKKTYSARSPQEIINQISDERWKKITGQ